MKATGIVRRIDDLGRVVIPKEIRRTLRIREGSPLEIYTDNDGNVIFRKYSPVHELSETATQAADVIHKLDGGTVVVFDRDHVVAVSGQGKKEYSERRVSQALEDFFQSGKSFIYEDGESPVMPIEGVSKKALAISPIISEGTVTGAVALLAGDDNAKGDQNKLILTKAAAMFLGKQMEE